MSGVAADGKAEGEHSHGPCDQGHHHHCGNGVSLQKPADAPEPSAAALLATRVGIVGLIGFVLFVTISFCTGVYYDRESAFHEALNCSESVLNAAGVRHWLQNGTLLGATRLGRLVLWDADLDYGFLVDDAADLNAVSSQLNERCFRFRATEKSGATNSELRVWRKCTHRLCAEFHQGKVVKERIDGELAEFIVTGAGASPSEQMFPLVPCRVAEVDAVCPHNAAFFLAQAYGSEWLTKPLTKLF